jgi:hypothetical protein
MKEYVVDYDYEHIKTTIINGGKYFYLNFFYDDKYVHNRIFNINSLTFKGCKVNDVTTISIYLLTKNYLRVMDGVGGGLAFSN